MATHLYFQFQSNTTWVILVFSPHFSDREEFGPFPINIPIMDQSVPSVCIHFSIVTTNSYTCTWTSFSFLLGSHIPRQPASFCLRLQNTTSSCCHCHFLRVAHGHSIHPFQVPQAYTRPVPLPLCVDAFLMPFGL